MPPPAVRGAGGEPGRMGGGAGGQRGGAPACAPDPRSVAKLVHTQKVAAHAHGGAAAADRGLGGTRLVVHCIVQLTEGGTAAHPRRLLVVSHLRAVQAAQVERDGAVLDRRADVRVATRPASSRRGDVGAGRRGAVFGNAGGERHAGKQRSRRTHLAVSCRPACRVQLTALATPSVVSGCATARGMASCARFHVAAAARSASGSLPSITSTPASPRHATSAGSPCACAWARGAAASASRSAHSAAGRGRGERSAEPWGNRWREAQQTLKAPCHRGVPGQHARPTPASMHAPRATARGCKAARGASEQRGGATCSAGRCCRPHLSAPGGRERPIDQLQALRAREEASIRLPGLATATGGSAALWGSLPRGDLPPALSLPANAAFNVSSTGFVTQCSESWSGGRRPRRQSRGRAQHAHAG